jgi:Flp pilus assembly pilin Flp
MQKIMTLALDKLYGLRDRLAETRGQALIEYVLIGGGVAVVVAVTVVVLQEQITETLTAIADAIDIPI